MSTFEDITWFALHSKLPDSDMIPLNEMIENSELDIKNYIDLQISDIKKKLEKMLSSTSGVGNVLRVDNITENKSGYFNYVLTKFVPPVSGVYKIGVEINYTAGDNWMPPSFDLWSVPVKRVAYATEANDTSSAGTGFNYSIETRVCDTWYYYFNNSIGRESSGFGSDVKKYIANNLGHFDCDYHLGIYPHVEYKEFVFLCEAGVPIVILAEDINSNTSSKYYRKIHSIRSTVTYGSV